MKFDLLFLKKLYTYKNSINFLYSEHQRYFGSTVMRGEQLSKMAMAKIDNNIVFSSIDYSYKNCILFLTKWAVYSLKVKDLEKLKSKGNVLIFDMLDGIPPENKINYADIFIASSKSIYNDYKKTLPKNKTVFLVDHYVDPRIIKNKKLKHTKLKIGYFGEIDNTFLTPKIREIVDVIPVSNIEQDQKWIGKLPNYNFHYAIRVRRDVYPNKPFLKGFTAAYSNSNILIQDSETEAVRWLGKKYPYLLKGNVTERKVLKMLSYIKDSYNGHEWNQGLKVMNKIKNKLSKNLIVGQLKNVINYAKKLKK